MKKISILVFICHAIVSCKKEESKEVFIRVRNQSAYQFENVVVNTYNQPKSYGVIKQGQNSVYMKFDMAYRYAYIKLTAAEKELILQPIDFVGETPLEPGKYTYSLSISDFNRGRLELKFQED